MSAKDRTARKAFTGIELAYQARPQPSRYQQVHLQLQLRSLIETKVGDVEQAPAPRKPAADIPLHAPCCGEIFLSTRSCAFAMCMMYGMLFKQAPAPRKPAADIPSHVPCCCGSMRGRFDVARTCVILEGGREVSPTEFERLAGKAASKKWKASIRIDKVRLLCSFAAVNEVALQM